MPRLSKLGVHTLSKSRTTCPPGVTIGTRGSQLHMTTDAAADPGDAASRPSASAPATTNFFTCLPSLQTCCTLTTLTPNARTTLVSPRLIAHEEMVKNRGKAGARLTKGQSRSCFHPAP